MKIKNIEWDIDMDYVYEMFDNMTTEEAVSTLDINIPVMTYSNMSTKEREDIIFETYHHCPGKLYDLLNLPEEVELLENETEIERYGVIDHLSDIYEFLIKDSNIVHYKIKLWADKISRDRGESVCMTPIGSDINIASIKDQVESYCLDSSGCVEIIDVDNETPILHYENGIWRNLK